MKTVQIIVDSYKHLRKKERNATETMIAVNTVRNHIAIQAERCLNNGLDRPFFKILEKLILNQGNRSSSVDQTQSQGGCI